MESTKSYAEALKSKPSTSSYHPFVKKPQQLPYVESTQIVISKDESEWSDVSSISSCSWPDSILEEILADSIANVPARLIIPSTVENHNSDDDDFFINDDFPQDTRGHHRAAGMIKNAKRSKRLYATVDYPFCGKRLVWADNEINFKSWRPFPGCRNCAHSRVLPQHTYRRNVRSTKAVEDDSNDERISSFFGK
ncbi:hypothetical protein Clacol_007856 [Clathrus columnatus]|uniref:Uncharacterized protein n=1 Tax=Clathrus columnatus TaxID=1419009 RepID=A0AAV5ANV6_9AGAM|nr:hypothetical protein Clacol_007856 [Clathrus columnatus]